MKEDKIEINLFAWVSSDVEMLVVSADSIRAMFIPVESIREIEHVVEIKFDLQGNKVSACSRNEMKKDNLCDVGQLSETSWVRRLKNTAFHFVIDNKHQQLDSLNPKNRHFCSDSMLFVAV